MSDTKQGLAYYVKRAIDIMDRIGWGEGMFARNILLDGIKESDRQAVDDSLAITKDWMKSGFSEQLDHTRRFVLIGELTQEGSLSVGIDDDSGICFISAFYAYRVDGWRDLPHIRNRKQFRDLIRALKGEQ